MSFKVAQHYYNLFLSCHVIVRTLSYKGYEGAGWRCFLEQETLPLLLSTGWFQERIRA